LIDTEGVKAQTSSMTKTTVCESCHVAQEIINPQVFFEFSTNKDNCLRPVVFSGETWWASF
jgi:hypothetical protein